MTSYRKINIASEEILNYSFSNSHPRWRKIGILAMLFSISKARTRLCQSFSYKKIVYNNKVRSLGYLNRCKILYVYVDITVLVWQKVNGASQHVSKVKKETLG